MAGPLRLGGIAVALTLLLSACGSSGGSTSASASAAPMKVGLVLPGPINDQGFNQSAYDALALLQSQLHVQTSYQENVSANAFQQAYTGYASEGYKVIIGQGFEFGDVTKATAPKYPNTDFIVTNSGPYNPGVPNAEGLQPASQDAAYLAGVVAGMASTTGKIGAIAGQQFPVLVEQLEAFKIGAESVRPGIQVNLNYLGTFNDVNKAKQTALAMASSGIDVIYHIADAAGIGVIQGCQQAHIYAIGWGDDQYSVAPGTVITSQIVNQQQMIVQAVQTVLDHTFKGGGTQFFGLDDSQVLSLAPIRGLSADLTQQIETKVSADKAAILAGTLKVPIITTP